VAGVPASFYAAAALAALAAVSAVFLPSERARRAAHASI
jgi:hypothetical protein